MTIFMPTVDATVLNDEQREAILPLVEGGRLVTCPRYDASKESKVLHNQLLRLLYRDPRWTVPLHWAWGMPHLIQSPSDEEWFLAESLAKSLIASRCFGDPQPVCIGHRLYRVYRENGSTFEMRTS